MLQNGHTLVKKVVLYSRCSSDEHRQDVENQLRELRAYCEQVGWTDYDEVWEFDSGFRGKQEKLQAVLEQIKHGKYQVFLTFSLDRFSRAHPSKVNALLDTLVERDGCRFISKQEGIDSDQPIVWHCIKPLFSYFAYVFSQNLSEKIKLGIKTKKEEGSYRGGRPEKRVDAERLRQLRLTYPDYGWRRLCEAYNDGLEGKRQVSVSLLRRICKKLSFGGGNGQGSDGWVVACQKESVGTEHENTVR